MKKNLTSIIIGLSLVAVPAAFADFVIGGNSATTGYGYGYGDCTTLGNGGYRDTPCTGGYAFGYGYGAGGILGATTGSTSGSNTTSGSGSSVISSAYVSGSTGSAFSNNPLGQGTNNAIGLPQTSGSTSTTGTTSGVTGSTPVKPVKKPRKGTLPATGIDSTMTIVAAASLIALLAVAYVATKKRA